jgi:hypothetical protein
MKQAIVLPKVISGFPGVGKSTLYRNRGDLPILDSDSSGFDKSEFPDNYLRHIEDAIAAGYTVLSSSHDPVRKGLVDRGIPFVLVYPALNCREEYLQRYRDRGSPKPFVDMMADKWVDFVVGCSMQKGCYHVCLGKGEFMPTLDQLMARI